MKGFVLLGVLVLGFAAVRAFREPAGVEALIRDASPPRSTSERIKKSVESFTSTFRAAPVAVATTPSEAPAEPIRAPSPRPIFGASEKCPADGGIAPDCFRCTTNADCQQGLACGIDEAGGLSCLAHGCDTDADCQGSLSCRVVTMPGLGHTIKQCRDGAVGLGKRCDVFSRGEKLSCARGALCGIDEKCGKLCANKTECAAGESCVTHPIEQAKHLCAKTCVRDSDCPSSLSCVGFGEGGAYCRRVTGGENCQIKGCGPGEACQIHETFAKSVAFDCAKCCNPLDANSCGQGFVCGRSRSGTCQSTCYKACKSPFDCADGGQNVACTTVDEDFTKMGCVPHLSANQYLGPDGGPLSIEEMRKFGLNVRDIYAE